MMENDYVFELLEHRPRAAAPRVVYRENGNVRSDLKGHEHFGFDDGVSPGVKFEDGVKRIAA